MCSTASNTFVRDVTVRFGSCIRNHSIYLSDSGLADLETPGILFPVKELINWGSLPRANAYAVITSLTIAMAAYCNG